MKNTLLFLSILFTCYSFSQTQIGSSIPGEAQDDQFGFSVSISGDGNVVAGGAPFYDLDNGMVRVYRNNAGTWQKLGDDIIGEFSGDRLGTSVSLSFDGNRIAVGSPLSDSGGTNQGLVRVYRINNTRWIQVGQDILGEDNLDSSGNSVSLSADGNILAIGAPGNNGNGTTSGSARVYEYNSTSELWEQIGDDIDGETAGDESGTAVHLSSDGTTVAIGAVFNDGENSNTSLNFGHVRVYRNQSGNWVQLGQDLDGEVTNDFYGDQVSLSSNGQRIAVGGRANNNSNGNNAGHVRIFQYNATSELWEQLGEDIDGEDADDQFGEAVDLSADGTVVAIGGSQANSTISGHVKIFQYNTDTSQWEQRGSTIDGASGFDRSGHAVGLSDNADTVVIGSIWNDDGGTSSGHIRMFSLDGILSVNEPLLQQTIFYPNPANNQFTIQLKEEIQFKRATIYNQLGQSIAVSTETLVDVRSLSQGIYFVEVITDQGKSVQKLIIE
jgi:hypothetical protein